jgi:hypothetical protein
MEGVGISIFIIVIILGTTLIQIIISRMEQKKNTQRIMGRLQELEKLLSKPRT